MNERAEILGRDLEEYFEPIYSSDAEYVIVFMDEHYAKKQIRKLQVSVCKNVS